jgi:hypothetical protein
MNHPLFSGLKKVILVRLPCSSSRPHIRRGEREVSLLTQYLFIYLRVSESLLLVIRVSTTATATKINFLKIRVFHIMPVGNVSEIEIPV